MSHFSVIEDRPRLRRLRRNLIAWYQREARDLPWRRTRDPYCIWISEIMLQQTTVAAVVGYFERFIARFPDVASLAAAPLSEVFRLWEGLGYYGRARNIHKTARIIARERGGCFPSTVDQLVMLPGIGRYTAGAIVSIALDRRAPIVEANTRRLYARLLGYRGDVRSAAGDRLLWEFAENVLPATHPGRINQALMELGSTVCRPAEPLCDECPVRTCCLAFARGVQHKIPPPAPRQKATHVTEAAVAVRRGDAYLLRRREQGERFEGLWDFERLELSNGHPPGRATRRGGASGAALTPRFKRQIEARIAETTGLTVHARELLTVIRHTVTRYRIRLLCVLADCEAGGGRNSQPIGEAGTRRWVRPKDFSRYALSTTGRRLADLLRTQSKSE